jgi:hypothetical protein
MSGRTAAWADLTGDGAGLLRDRISQETVIPVRHRLKAMAVTVLRPPDRRSRDVGPPDLGSRWPEHGTGVDPARAGDSNCSAPSA